MSVEQLPLASLAGHAPEPPPEVTVGPPPGDIDPGPPVSSPGAPGAGDRTPLGTTLRRGDFVIAGLVALTAMVIAGFWRSALVPTDPWHYVQGALSFPEPTWRPAGMTRWGFVLPIIPFARLWGDATATYYVIPLLSTGLLAAVLVLLGTRAVSRVAGLLGALLALAVPIVFVNLTRGYADLTATALTGLALLLATLAVDRARRDGDLRRRYEWAVEWPPGRAPEPGAGGWRRSGRFTVTTSGRTRMIVVAAGFVTGWSFETRETAVFALPVIVWALWPLLRRPVELACFVAPIVGWLVLDMSLSAWIYGDPLIKLHILLGADISTSEVSSDAGYVGHSRYWYATILPRSIWQLSGGPVLFLCLLVGAVGGLVLHRQLGRIWLWGMLAGGLLWAQGGPLTPDHPSVRLDVARYWVSFIVPLMVCAAATIVVLVRRTERPGRLVAVGAAAVLVAGVLVPSARFATRYPGLVPNGGAAMSELRDYLAATGAAQDRIIWSDWGTQRIMPAYQNAPFGTELWQARSIRSLNRIMRLKPEKASRYPRPGSLVVLYSEGDRTCWHCRRAMVPVQAAFGPLPGEGWELLFTSSTGTLRLYRLGPQAQWSIPRD